MTTLSKEGNTRIAAGLRRKGVQAERLHAMGQAAGRSAASIVRDSFIAIKALASEQQRDINRTLLPQIQNKMQVGYTAAQVCHVPAVSRESVGEAWCAAAPCANATLHTRRTPCA